MEKETIGIIGAGAGAGTTHLTLLLANYLSGVKNRKTAVLEWNSHGDFDRFGVCCLGLGETKDQYQILGVSYFPLADNETLVQCMCGDFQAVLLDCGREEEGRRADLIRCRKKLVMGSFCEWQMGYYMPLLKERKQSKEGWHYLCAFGSEESRKLAEKHMNVPILRVPCTVDAYGVTEETIRLFGQLLS